MSEHPIQTWNSLYDAKHEQWRRLMAFAEGPRQWAPEQLKAMEGKPRTPYEFNRIRHNMTGAEE